jgi:hypothetical protein
MSRNGLLASARNLHRRANLTVYVHDALKTERFGKSVDESHETSLEHHANTAKLLDFASRAGLRVTRTPTGSGALS